MQNDQFSMIIDYIKVVAREAYENRIKVALCFAVVSVAALAVGNYYPQTYESSATVFADQQNIIRPLLSGQAAVTKVQNHNRIVQEVIYSPRILNKVAYAAGLASEADTPAKLEGVVRRLRRGITVRPIGKSSYIKISYTSGSPEESFEVLTAIVDIFIKDSAETKRNESREAYEFIDKQVKAYKEQLQEAEENLKAFRAASVDGNENTVKGRIAELRSEVERAKLDIDDTRTRIKTIEDELGRESQFVARRYKADVFRERLALKQQELDALLLTYTDTYPDVVAIRLQIEDLRRSIADASTASTEGIRGPADPDGSINPLYNTLREKLSEAKVELQTKQRRLAATETLLVKEHERLKRIAEGQAELAELNRDYDVNKGIYEDMLERKEKARLSMTLDIEGQGVSYKIQEPASFPLNPQGLTFMHFAVVGPFIGILIPLGLLVVYVFFDPRIRFASQLSAVQAPLLAVVPHMSTPIARRVWNFDVLVLGSILLMVALVYGGVAYIKLIAN